MFYTIRLFSFVFWVVVEGSPFMVNFNGTYRKRGDYSIEFSIIPNNPTGIDIKSTFGLNVVFVCTVIGKEIKDKHLELRLYMRILTKL